jgi:Ankyrin repeats (3 copies)
VNKMDNGEGLDALFHQSVCAIDAGDMTTLEHLLATHPELTHQRLEAPGAWLRDQVGGALDGFFQKPYLLWFVAEDPVRNAKLPGNIAQITRTIIKAAESKGAQHLQEQLDYALRLVCWSWISRECDVQIELIDVLVDAGASLDGRTVYQGRCGTHCDSAIFNGNFAAAERLLERGATVTLSTALCLGRWSDVEHLARTATLAEKQDAFVLAALNGRAEALGRMLALGVDPTTVSAQNYSHATALHHAVCSGSIDAVKVLVEAGADLTRRDSVYHGTPLGWAGYYEEEQKGKSRAKQFKEIAAYLREKGCPA